MSLAAVAALLMPTDLVREVVPRPRRAPDPEPGLPRREWSIPEPEVPDDKLVDSRACAGCDDEACEFHGAQAAKRRRRALRAAKRTLPTIAANRAGTIEVQIPGVLGMVKFTEVES